jgi:glycine cleavage system pyridoxal-binding protein P
MLMVTRPSRMALQTREQIQNVKSNSNICNCLRLLSVMAECLPPSWTKGLNTAEKVHSSAGTLANALNNLVFKKQIQPL